MEEDYIEPSLPNSDNELEDSLVRVSGMYKDWFLDYASYVILERAVPSIEDGFKPVQRRILHSMKDCVCVRVCVCVALWSLVLCSVVIV